MYPPRPQATSPSRAASVLGVIVAVGLTATMATSEVLVRPGDTLSEIALDNGVSTRELASVNGIDDPNLIRSGDVLLLPESISAEAETTPRIYVVAAGDTLSEIAAEHGISTRALAELNGIDDLDHVRSGMSLSLDAAAYESDANDADVEAEASDEPAAATPAPAQVSGGEGQISYMVRAGDTIAGIAERFGVSAAVLAAANGIADADLVIEGNVLTIPPRSSDAASLDLLPERLRNSPTRLALIPVFDLWAAEYGIDPALFKAMTWVESGWQNDIVSPVGAVGIGQLMPDTVDHMNQTMGTSLDPTVPVENIRMSARFLAFLLERTDGDQRLALSAYHQGLASVRTKGVFRSSENYVAATLALSARF